MINAFVEEAQAIISQMRNLEVSYFENLGDVAARFMTSLHINEELVVPESLKTIMSDRESMINASAASHDLHLQVIDNR